MSQPLNPVITLANANMQLALKLADAWRETGQKVFEIAGQGAGQAAEEVRTGLASLAKGGASLVPGAGPLHDYFGKLEMVRETTAKEIETAINEWRESLSSAASSALDTNEFPLDALFKPWLAKQASAPTAPEAGQ